MKYTSQLLTAASGSIRGFIATHGRGCAVLRGRANGVNPSSNAQNPIRNTFSNLAARWANVLTDSQRDAWNAYAAATPQTDRLAQSIPLTGFNAHLQANAARPQPLTSYINDPPQTNGKTVLTPPRTLAAFQTTNDCVVNFDPSDTWANEIGGFLLIYFARPQNQSRPTYKGSYQFALAVPGDPSPPVNPVFPTVPSTISVNQLLFARFRAVTADGRISSETFDQILVTI